MDDYWLEEPKEPEEGDYVLSDCGALGSMTHVAVHGLASLGAFASEDKAEDAIRADAMARGIYPDVWRLSDHGNWHRIDAFAWAVPAEVEGDEFDPDAAEASYWLAQSVEDWGAL